MFDNYCNRFRTQLMNYGKYFGSPVKIIFAVMHYQVSISQYCNCVKLIIGFPPTITFKKPEVMVML